MNKELEARQWPRCIHLAGADGTGKTTQARALLTLLQRQDIPARRVWLRFPRLFCTPFLIYARLRRYSHYEVVDGHRHGYWDLKNSWIMSKIFPWVLLLDTGLLALFQVYLFLWQGDWLICDRFVVDTLVDLMTGLDDDTYDERVPGRFFRALLPKEAWVAILDIEVQTAVQRSPDLAGDRTWSRRRAIYQDLARRWRRPIIPNETPAERTTACLIEALACLQDE